MSPESEYKAVRQAIYFIRSMHKKPSADRIISSMRAIGSEAPHKSRVCVHMKKLFADEASKKNQIGTTVEPEIKHERTDGEPFQNTRADQDSRLLDRVETTSQPEPLAQAEEFIKAINTLIAPPRGSLPDRSEDVPPLTCAAPPQESAIKREEDLKVGALLDLLQPHVKTILVAMNASDWRKRNVDAARSLVNSGMRPHEVLSAWQRLKSHDGAQYFMLSRLQIAMQQDAQPKGKPQNKFRSEIDDLWDRKAREAWAQVGRQV